MEAPVIIYDRKKQVVVRRNSDGTETEVGKRLRKGSYSERIGKKSEIVVFAGPNGSGKSTFTSLLKPSMDYINTDEIKKILKCSDFEAAKLAEKQREQHFSYQGMGRGRRT